MAAIPDVAQRNPQGRLHAIFYSRKHRLHCQCVIEAVNAGNDTPIDLRRKCRRQDPSPELTGNARRVDERLRQPLPATNSGTGDPATAARCCSTTCSQPACLRQYDGRGHGRAINLTFRRGAAAGDGSPFHAIQRGHSGLPDPAGGHTRTNRHLQQPPSSTACPGSTHPCRCRRWTTSLHLVISYGHIISPATCAVAVRRVPVLVNSAAFAVCLSGNAFAAAGWACPSARRVSPNSAGATILFAIRSSRRRCLSVVGATPWIDMPRAASGRRPTAALPISDERLPCRMAMGQTADFWPWVRFSFYWLGVDWLDWPSPLFPLGQPSRGACLLTAAALLGAGALRRRHCRRLPAVRP